MHQASGKQVSTHSIASLNMTERASQAILELLSRCDFATSSLAQVGHLRPTPLGQNRFENVLVTGPCRPVSSLTTSTVYQLPRFATSLQCSTSVPLFSMKLSSIRLASHIARPESFIVASKRTPFGAYGGK